MLWMPDNIVSIECDEISGERSDWTGMNGDTGRIEHFIAMLDDEDPSTMDFGTFNDDQI